MCKCHETTYNCDQGRDCPARAAADDLRADLRRVDLRRIQRWLLALVGAWGLLAVLVLLSWSGR